VISIILKIDKSVENTEKLSFIRGTKPSELSLVIDSEPPNPSFFQYLSLLSSFI